MSAVLHGGVTAGHPAVLAIEGAGGIGKTALALFWAQRNAERFPDGQLFADLRGFDPSGTPVSATAVLHAFLLSFGVPPNSIPADQQAAVAMYRSILSDKRILVFLDNALDAAHVIPLMPNGPSNLVLVTSRHRLPSLQLHGATRLSLDPLPRLGARAFLARRANDLGAEPMAVETLLTCCAGLPLALAIVAARAANNPTFPLSVLAAELEQEATGLNAFDAGDGATNLRAALSWSVAALDADQASLFRLLGLAPAADVGLNAAASLIARPVPVVAQLMHTLEALHLVRQHRPGRFQMHDLVRRHASELSEAKDSVQARTAALRRLVDFYLHTAMSADRLLYPHRTQVPVAPPEHGCVPLSPAEAATALDWFAVEHRQILAAQRTAGRLGWSEQVWLLSRALDTYLYRGGHLTDNVESSRSGTEAADLVADDAVRALAHRQLGRAYTRSGELTLAEDALRLALTLTRRTGDVAGQAHTLHDLARVSSLDGRVEQALTHSEAAVGLYRAAGNPVGEAHVLNAQGYQHAVLGNHERARQCGESALSLHAANGNLSGQVATLETLGHIAQQAGKYTDAAKRYASALALCRQERNRFAEAQIIERLADTHIAQREPSKALAELQIAQELYASQSRVSDAERVRLRAANL